MNGKTVKKLHPGFRLHGRNDDKNGNPEDVGVDSFGQDIGVESFGYDG